MKTVKDIMSANVHTISDAESLFTGRTTMGEKNIRHLPVLNPAGDYVGLLTQRVVLQEDIKIIDKYGFDKLETVEKRIPVSDILIKSDPLSENESIESAGKHLLKDKHGAIVVAENNKIKGILTSIDFVHLALELLKQTETA